MLMNLNYYKSTVIFADRKKSWQEHQYFIQILVEYSTYLLMHLQKFQLISQFLLQLRIQDQNKVPNKQEQDIGQQSKVYKSLAAYQIALRWQPESSISPAFSGTPERCRSFFIFSHHSWQKQFHAYSRQLLTLSHHLHIPKHVLQSFRNQSITLNKSFSTFRPPIILAIQWRLLLRVSFIFLSFMARSFSQVFYIWGQESEPWTESTAGKLQAQLQGTQFQFERQINYFQHIFKYRRINFQWTWRPFRRYMNFPRFRYAESLTHLLLSFVNLSIIFVKFVYLQDYYASSIIDIIISAQLFLILQLAVFSAFQQQKGKILYLKKCSETILQMTGKCFIASFLTFSLASSPSDKNSNPINCSHKTFPMSQLNWLIN